jgi:hypothetical protein
MRHNRNSHKLQTITSTTVITNDIDKYVEFTKGVFGFLKEFRLTRTVRNDEISRYQLEILLTNLEGELRGDLYLKFEDVLGLKVEGIEHQSQLYFEITDVRDFYLDGIAYEVSEITEHGLNFSCRSFSAQFNSA